MTATVPSSGTLARPVSVRVGRRSDAAAIAATYSQGIGRNTVIVEKLIDEKDEEKEQADG